MLGIKIITVGKMKEKFYIDACSEYLKRLSAYCKAEVEELPEAKRSANPSPAETEAAILKEAEAIKAKIPKGAAVNAMSVEGKTLDSVAFSELMTTMASGGASKICFIIGGSDGLHPSVKAIADRRISVSPMTFPHHLFRVMLLEQIYRGFKIAEGGKYHK